jgi:streptogramin lyase
MRHPARVFFVAAVAAATTAAGAAPASTTPAAAPRAGALAIVSTIALDGAPSSLAVTARAVWASIGMGGVVRIDRGTNQVTSRIEPGGAVIGLAAGHGAVWAVDVFGDRVLRIDPETSTVTREIRVGRLPNGIAVGHGSVWVQNQLDSTVMRIDPDSGRVRATIFFGPGELWPGSLLATPDDVWVVSGGGSSVSRIDPLTTSVTREIPVLAARSLAFAHRSVWVGRADSRSLVRIGRSRIDHVDVAGYRADGYGPALAGGAELWLAAAGAVVQEGSRPALVTRLGRRHHLSAIANSGDLWVADQTAGSVVRLRRTRPR